jgi:DNA polymerase-3 subunit alpha
VQYTELHLHTGYSLLDGLNTPAEYMERAKELGMTHLAQTDHGTNSGHREFQREAKKAGIVPILGQEMYISATGRTDRTPVKKRDDNTQAYNHLIVLAQNEKGLANLNRLSEIAWTEGFYSKPRIDMEVLEEYQDGLIVLSGCLNGLIAKAIANDEKEKALGYTADFKRIFGDRFFMEVQQHNPKEINEGLLYLAKKFDIKPVATSDCHYAREEDLWLEEAMLILSTKPTPAKEISFAKSQKMEMLERFNYLYPERKMSFQDFDLFLHSAENHRESNKKSGIPDEAISNTMEVAGMIGDYPYYEGLDLLPKPKKGDPYEILEAKAWEALREKDLATDPVAVDRLKQDLQIVKDKGFATYFLVLDDTLGWAREQDILVGPGRGSGAGFFLNYVLDITKVNPIEHNLLSFRFLNPERNDWPDVDVDFEIKRRSEVKARVQRRFKHVASISTFGTFQGKNSVRDAARVYRVPLGDLNRALKGADWPSDVEFFPLFEATERGKEFKKKYPEVMRLAKFMYKRLRTQGMHAGGIVVSKEPINKYAPMQSAKDNSDPSGQRIPVVALDMDEAADLGLIKMDFLGLKALTIVAETLKLIEKRHGKKIDPYEIPLDDPKVYKSLSEGFTKGVFQAEAVPYTNLLVQMGGVKNFDELVASNALVRPGAAKSSAGKAFIERKEGREMVEYHHPDMQWFTRDTYGVVIYQEQVMLAMTELAGMTMSEADKVRKIIGKKKDVAEFEQYKARWVEGATPKIGKGKADNLWKDFEAHAGYSFNKSHAVAYSMLSVWTAWLKENYPVEFMVNVLKEETDNDSLVDYLIETKRMGLRVLLPHVNVSGKGYEIQSDEKGDYIRIGLSDIKYISDTLADRLIRKRPYDSFQHLADVVTEKGSGLNTRVLASLNKVGGAAFHDNPRRGNERDHFFEYLNIPAFPSADLHPRVKAQFRPLDEYSEDEAFVIMGMVRKIKTGAGWARVEVVDESGTAGIFADESTEIETGMMYAILVSGNRVAKYASVEQLLNDEGGDFQEFLEATRFPDVPEGMYKVIAFQKRLTKAGKMMGTVVLADEHKRLTTALVFPGKDFNKFYVKMRDGAVVDVKLKETKDGSVFVENVL